MCIHYTITYIYSYISLILACLYMPYMLCVIHSAVPGPGGQGFGPVVASAEARDEDRASDLWALTEKLVEGYC